MAPALADRQLVLSDLLCFIVSKVSSVDSRSLKSIILDYYRPEHIVTAKCRLLDDVNDLNVDKLPRIARRREGENCVARDLDDIFYLLSYLDEQKLLNSLPVYVTDDPDKMPSCRLFEGDLRYFFKKLDILDNKVESYWKSMAAMVGEVRSHLSEWPALAQSALAQSGGHVNQKSTLTCRPAGATSLHSDTTAVQQPSDQLSWAAMSSTPSRQGNRFTVLASADEDEVGDAASTDEEAFTTVRKRRRIRSREGASPPVVGQAANRNNGNNENQPTSQTNVNQLNNPQAKPRKLVIGKSANSQSKITAAGVITKKRVYCLDNVNADCDVEDIKQHITNLSVRLYTCHQVKPRQRRYNDEQSVNRKAFRVCIAADDRDCFLDPAAWPDSIVVADWYFKPRDNQGASGQDAAGSGHDVASVYRPQQRQQQTDVASGNIDMEICNNANGNVDETTVLYHHGAASNDS